MHMDIMNKVYHSVSLLTKFMRICIAVTIVSFLSVVVLIV